MNASTFFNRSTGPQASTNSRPSNPRANPGTGINANSPTSPTVGSSSSTTANGFNFHFEFPSINFSNITDTLTSARFSPPNLSTLIPKQRSSTTTRNETPSPSTSTGSNPSSGSRLIMVCENCGTKFHFLKRKKTCSDCSMDYCVNCFPKDGNHDFFASLRRARCRRCRIFNMQPLEKTALLELRIKDLKWYMDKKRIPHRFCKEKSELVDLILRNGDHSRRHYSPSNSYPTSPLNNLNTSSNTSSNHSTNRIPRQDEESWVFVETEDPINRPSNINRPPRDNSSEANNINTNTNTSTTTDTPLILTSNNTDSTADSNSSSNSSTTDATTSGSNHRNEETVSKENINYDSNSSSSLNTDFKPFNIADLTSEEQIRDLSIRQIKLLLTRNFVDFKGCCEKEELLEKAIRLWRDVNKARERGSQDLDDDNACKICMEKLIDCVLLECGHVVTCIDCGKRMNECPICRQYVVRAVRIFKS